MTFLEFKTELISRYRKNEFDQFLHLLIKSTNWNELLTLLKKEPLKYISYGLEKGIISEAFLLDIPEIERKNNNILNSTEILSNINDTILLFGNAHLTITQNLSNRCKIVLIGNAQLSGISNNTAMIEVDMYQTSKAEITANDDSFVFISTNENAILNLTATNNSTIKSFHDGNSLSDIVIGRSSFLNSVIKHYSTLNLISEVNDNYKVVKKDKSIINFTNGIQI